MTPHFELRKLFSEYKCRGHLLFLMQVHSLRFERLQIQYALHNITLHYITFIWQTLLSKAAHNKCIPKVIGTTTKYICTNAS
uniref:Uncharacterized protein n=1 Tax=Anguilla anguilla TaxID=7936 RepID=A0A0E9TBL4_ANGAN